jgi:hypothetical protein
MMLKVAHSQLMYSDMPIEVQECIQIFSNKTGDVMMYDTTDATYVACLKQIMLKNRGLEGLNITVDDVQFMDNLIDSVSRHIVLNRNFSRRTNKYVNFIQAFLFKREDNSRYL